ncbi:MAG: transporter [Nitrospirota bacterium]
MGMSLFVLPMSVFLACFVFVSSAFAAHPLITDDTGIQGAGKFQIELNGEYGSDRETSSDVEAVERHIEAGITISYGVTEVIDIVIGAPYVWSKSFESDLTTPAFIQTNEKGISDASFEVKWKFYETGGLSFALKPGISFPTGSEKKGLGTGKYGFSAYFITTQELELWAFHLNLGYMRNNNRADEREDLYHLSIAAEYSIKDTLRVVVNIGQERNPDRMADRNPAFALAGFIYGITENLDVDLGLKAGITAPETDRTVLAGMAYRF